MNIFIFDLDVYKNAKMYCDKHCSKMILETAQLLCSPFETGTAPYKRTHYNHPCAIWLRESQANFNYLLKLGLALSEEFEYRRGKKHKSQEVIQWCRENNHFLMLPDVPMTPFAQAMPEQYKSKNHVVGAYRNYFNGEKRHLFSWTKRPTPSWVN